MGDCDDLPYLGRLMKHRLDERTFVGWIPGVSSALIGVALHEGIVRLGDLDPGYWLDGLLWTGCIFTGFGIYVLVRIIIASREASKER